MTDLDLPLALTRTWIVAFGLVVGSFLNVVVHRVPRGESVVTPRSRCPGCGRLIRWYENVPILSWLALRARCAGCGMRISWRYPAVELLTAALFLACHERFGFTVALAIAVPFVAAMLALVFIDAGHLLLPDSITLPLALLGAALAFVSPLTTPEDALLGALMSFFALEGMNLAYKLVRGRDGFGGGDTKMMVAVGLFLGWRMALLTLVLGSFLGVLLGIPALAWSRRRRAP
jgi:leader peptidase (prepilin peptidase)/N-methyltransferase